jgi:hypothetical protein
MMSDTAPHINHTILLFADNETYLGIMFIMDNIRSKFATRVICMLFDPALSASSVHQWPSSQ